MAHTVTFTLDIRHTEDAKLVEIEKACQADFARIAAEDSEKGCSVKFEELVDSPAVVFHEDCVKAVEGSAEEVCSELSMQGVNAKDGGSLWKPMISGAGHDSCYTNRRCPTSMIFTQTKDGVSHNPREYCSPEDWWASRRIPRPGEGDYADQITQCNWGSSFAWGSLAI